MALTKLESKTRIYQGVDGMCCAMSKEKKRNTENCWETYATHIHLTGTLTAPITTVTSFIISNWLQYIRKRKSRNRYTEEWKNGAFCTKRYLSLQWKSSIKEEYEATPASQEIEEAPKPALVQEGTPKYLEAVWLILKLHWQTEPVTVGLCGAELWAYVVRSCWAT